MSTDTLEVSIGPVARDALDQAVDVLARAFRDNPLNRAVLESRPPDARRRCNALGMRATLPVAREHGLALAAHVAARVSGVLIAAPPNAYPLPPPSAFVRLRTLVGQGLRAAQRWNRVFEALDAHHPRTPHWYLATLGVDPRRQRQGVGRALLEHWLARVDPDRVASYLETDSEKNVAFYERAGFEVVGDAKIFDARVWFMRRAAREGG